MQAFEQFYYFIGEMGECLGVPMFFSCFYPETTKAMVIKTGFGFLETAIETQIENTNEAPFLWLFGWKD